MKKKKKNNNFLIPVRYERNETKKKKVENYQARIKLYKVLE